MMTATGTGPTLPRPSHVKPAGMPYTGRASVATKSRPYTEHLGAKRRHEGVDAHLGDERAVEDADGQAAQQARR